MSTKQRLVLVVAAFLLAAASWAMVAQADEDDLSPDTEELSVTESLDDLLTGVSIDLPSDPDLSDEGNDSTGDDNLIAPQYGAVEDLPE
jgi:hypothetical protein